jgi:uncharacterized membrane-anchored protein YitT (DUF2179 family)
MAIPKANVRRDSLRAMTATVILLTLGALVGAVQVVVFMIPAQVVPGGVSALAIILNELIGSPVGLMILVFNIPIQVIGYRMLGGWRIVAATVYVVVIYSVSVDLMTVAGLDAVSDDRLLNAMFGGAVGGIAGGLVYRAGGTYGGTSTLALILQNRLGTPISATLLYTEAALIALAGLVFGWESALYAVIAMVVYGLATDYVLEGPSVIRTVIIITEYPREISDMVIHDLNRTVTAWNARGMYKDEERCVLYVTILRSETNRLRDRVLAIDPGAFMVIGQGHAAYGEGFRHLKPRPIAPPESPEQ